jgi:GDP-D-mannose dehydratase
MTISKSNKVSLIVGSHGQDGILLTQRLKELDYSVVGLGRNDIDLFISGQLRWRHYWETLQKRRKN